MSAIRYTFADSRNNYDELLQGLIPDFLSAMTDENLVWAPLDATYQNV